MHERRICATRRKEYAPTEIICQIQHFNMFLFMKIQQIYCRLKLKEKWRNGAMSFGKSYEILSDLFCEIKIWHDERYPPECHTEGSAVFCG